VKYREEPRAEYAGLALDSADAALLPENLNPGKKKNPGVFAVYRFNADKNRVAFLARMFGRDSSRVIQLFILDKEKDELTPGFALAEYKSDSSRVHLKEGWIYKNRKGKFEAVMKIQDSFNENARTIESNSAATFSYLFYQANIFGDTISENQIKIITQFRHLLRN
jgi:hypothetical protein